jgi:putative spermidine/putrescine transport system permease protein
MPRVRPWTWLKVAAGLIYLFMLGPIVITTLVSFNAGTRSVFPPEDFSLRWWHEALTPQWLEPVWFSLQLATLAAVLSTALALPLAFALTRHRFPGRDLLVLLVLGPLLLPALATGIGLLQMLQLGGFAAQMGMGTLLIGHIVICVPFAVRTVAVSLQGLPANVEAAAASLGARRWLILALIIVPLIRNGLVAGALFAFIHSFTDINLSLFLARPGATPVTVKILGCLEFGFAPTLAAVSAVTLLIPLLVVLAVQRTVRLGDFIYGDKGAK